MPRTLTSTVSTFMYECLRVYWRVSRPTTLGSRAIVVNDGCVRLVRLSYVKGWYLPGGGVDRGESFEQGLIRELREECGIEAKSYRLFGMYHAAKRGKSDHVAIYIVDDFETIPNAKPDREIEEQRDFPLRSLPAGVSPATRRRINEYLRGAPDSAVW